MHRAPSLAPLLSTLAAAFPAPAQDTADAQRAALDRDLAGHPFFEKVEFNRVERDGFLFLIQRPPRDDAEYDRKVVTRFLPFLLELGRVFARDYVEPAGLQRRPDYAFYAIAVLASAGSYHDYAQAVGAGGLHQSRAHYTPQWRLAVTYEDLFAARNVSGEERRALLHEFVHMMQHAHSASDMPSALWFNEGLADYRSVSTNLASSLRTPRVSLPQVQLLGAVYGNPRERSLAYPLADLLAITDYGQAIESARARVEDVDPGLALSVFYAESYLFVRFLHEHDDGAHRPLLNAWMRELLAGRGSVEALAAAASAAAGQPGDAVALEAPWLAFVTEVMQRRFRGFPDLTGGRTAAVATGTEEIVELHPLTAFDPATLALGAGEPGPLLDACRSLAASGRFDDALAVLGDHADGEIARERARLAAVVALRADLLAWAAGKTVELRVDGAGVEARLVEVLGDQLRIELDREDATTGIDAADPGALLKIGWKSRHFREREHAWAEAYLRWLGGEEPGEQPLKRMLARSDPRSKALAADAGARIDAETGWLARWLWECGRGVLAEEPADARRELEALRAIVARFGATHPLIAARKGGFETYARALAERAFDPTDLAALGMTCERVEQKEGRVVVRYDHTTDPRPDFAADGYWTAERFGWGLLANDSPLELRPGGDTLELVGSGVLDWQFPIRPPFSVQLELTMKAPGLALLGVCVDDGGYVFASPFGNVEIVDGESGIEDHVGGNDEAFLDTEYAVRIEHDGQRIECHVNGKRTAELQRVGGRVRGHVALAVHSGTPVQIGRLTIDAVPDRTAQAELRDRYVERVVAGLW